MRDSGRGLGDPWPIMGLFCVGETRFAVCNQKVCLARLDPCTIEFEDFGWDLENAMSCPVEKPHRNNGNRRDGLGLNKQ